MRRKKIFKHAYNQQLVQQIQENASFYASRYLRYFGQAITQVGLPRVLEYSRVLDSKNYSCNYLLLEYSLNSTPGCKFPLPVSIFANLITDLLSFVQIWTSVAICTLISFNFQLHCKFLQHFCIACSLYWYHFA